MYVQCSVFTKNFFRNLFIVFHFRMWSLKRINLTKATRTIRQSLLQQDRSVNSPQVKNFNALGMTEIAQSPKQVIVLTQATN